MMTVKLLMSDELRVGDKLLIDDHEILIEMTHGW